jgi:hypothetical protein
MSAGKSTLSIIRGHRTVFVAITVILLLIELGIFAVAALKSGEHYKLQFWDQNGDLVYETDGKNLNDFNVYQFRMTHGPVQNYKRKLVKTEIPFPFRAWFVAAFAIPLGMFLFFAFILKAYEALFYGEEEKRDVTDSGTSRYETRLEKIIGGVNRFNIFMIAVVAFLAVIAYWVLPNLLIYVGEVSLETVMRFKWAILLVGLLAFGLLVWIIYLKYLLAKKSMDSQVEVDKHRLALEYKYNAKAQPQLEHHQNAKDPPHVVTWEADDVIDEERINEPTKNRS